MADGILSLGGKVDFNDLEPGNPRQLRIFISHRHDRHESIYTLALEQMKDHFGELQDLSVPEDAQIKGPRGGFLNDIDMRTRLTARIYSSDILIAPSTVAVGISEWTSFEIELAAFAFSLPILFVKEPDQQKNAALASYVMENCDRCMEVEMMEDSIADAVIQLMAREKPKSQVDVGQFTDELRDRRTPFSGALDDVMSEFPYLPYQTVTENERNRMNRRRRRF